MPRIETQGGRDCREAAKNCRRRPVVALITMPPPTFSSSAASPASHDLRNRLLRNGTRVGRIKEVSPGEVSSL